MTNTNEPKEEEKAHNSKYNQKIIELGENYLALQTQRLHTELATLKAGARNLAKKSSFPQLQEICDILDKIKLN